MTGAFHLVCSNRPESHAKKQTKKKTSRGTAKEHCGGCSKKQHGTPLNWRRLLATVVLLTPEQGHVLTA